MIDRRAAYISALIMKLLSMLLIAIPALVLIIVCSDVGLPYSYVLLLSIYSVLVALFMVSDDNVLKENYEKLILGLFIFALLLRTLYMIRTNSSVIPLYDGYKDLIVSYIFYNENRIYIIDKPYIFNYASSFPLLNTFTVIVAYMLGIDVLSSSLLVSLVVGYIMIITMLILARFIGMNLRLRLLARYVIIYLILSTICPELIYYSIVYYSRHYSIALYYLLMYMVLATLTVRSSKYVLPMVLVSLAMPLSYSLFPIMTLTFLASLLILFKLLDLIGKYFHISTKSMVLKFIMIAKLSIRALKPVILTFMVGEALAFGYYVSWEVLNSSKSVLQSLLAFYERLSKPIIERQMQASYWIPPVLRTPWNVLIQVRDVLLYGGAIPGVIIALLQLKAESRYQKSQALVQTLLIFMTIYIILYVVFVERCRFSFQTIIYLTLYLILHFTSITYLKCIESSFRHVLAGTIVLFIVISGLAFWSHRLLLLHYYNPSISFIEAGDHNILYVYAKEFLHKYLVLDDYKVYTDDQVIARYIFYMLSRNIHVYSLNKIDLSRYLSFRGNRIAIMFLGPHLLLGPYGWLSLNLEQNYFKKIKIIKMLNEHLDLIYRLKEIHIYVDIGS